MLVAVAPAAGSSTVTITSSDNGATWSAESSFTLGGTTLYMRYAYPISQWCVMSRYSAAVIGTTIVSSNGSTWTNKVDQADEIGAGRYGTGQWVVPGYYSTDQVIFHSTNGTSWHYHTGLISPDLSLDNSVLGYNGTNTFVLANAGTNYATSTDDGVSWTNRTGFPASNALLDIVWSGTHFIAVQGTATNQFFRSTDGVSWATTNTPSSTSYTFTGMASDGAGTVVALAGNVCIYSVDHGATWNVGAVPPINGTWPSLAWSGTNFVAINKGSRNCIYIPPSSLAAGSWTQSTTHASQVRDWMSMASNHVAGVTYSSVAGSQGSCTPAPAAVSALLKEHYLQTSYLKLLFNATPLPYLFDNATSAPVTNLYVTLHTADPTDGGAQTSSEVTTAQWGSAYARVPVARTPSGWYVEADVARPITDIVFPAISSGSGCTVTHFSVGTNSTGAGNLLYSGPIVPPVVISSEVYGSEFRIGRTSSIVE